MTIRRSSPSFADRLTAEADQHDEMAALALADGDLRDAQRHYAVSARLRQEARYLR